MTDHGETCVGSADSGTSVYQTEGDGANPIPTLAWQRQIRERRRLEDSDVDLFGRWWATLDMDIKKSTVRPISTETAAKVIYEYEWLGSMPAIVLACYGIYFDNALAGAVVYSPEYGENLGTWTPYGYDGKIVLLSRGACVHWAHPHAASRLIRRSINLLPPQFEVVTATVDATAGEIGTIYQACGFHYVGQMRDGASRQALIDPNGNVVGERALRARFGHSRSKELLGQLPGWRIGSEPSKSRYFCFRGADRDKHLAAIAHLIKPYPKRGAVAA